MILFSLCTGESYPALNPLTILVMTLSRSSWGLPMNYYVITLADPSSKTPYGMGFCLPSDCTDK